MDWYKQITKIVLNQAIQNYRGKNNFFLLLYFKALAIINKGIFQKMTAKRSMVKLCYRLTLFHKEVFHFNLDQEARSERYYQQRQTS